MTEKVGEPDPVVALAAEFGELLAEAVEACRLRSTLYDEACRATRTSFRRHVEAQRKGSSDETALRRRWRKDFAQHAKANGYDNAFDEAEDTGRRLRKLVAQLVGTPATSPAGIITKLDTMITVEREYDAADLIDGHDEWLTVLQADIERLLDA